MPPLDALRYAYAMAYAVFGCVFMSSLYMDYLLCQPTCVWESVCESPRPQYSFLAGSKVWLGTSVYMPGGGVWL